MSLISELERLDRFYDLVIYGATGSVKSLANKFSVSESTIKRMVKDLEYYKKVSISYCRRCNSYLECITSAEVGL